MTARKPNYHYAIGTYKISESDTQERLMLYRFRGKKDRAAWIAGAPAKRLAITRDVARIVFAPHFRAYGYNRTHWIPLEILGKESIGARTRTVRINAAYFVDSAGAVVSSNFQMCEVREKTE